jgi:hypothetical protein
VSTNRHSIPPPAAERMNRDDAFLSRTDLRDLGLSRRAIDVVFGHCAVVMLPGFSRPLIRAADYRAFVEQHTYRGNRVRPGKGARR